MRPRGVSTAKRSGRPERLQPADDAFDRAYFEAARWTAPCLPRTAVPRRSRMDWRLTHLGTGADGLDPSALRRPTHRHFAGRPDPRWLSQNRLDRSPRPTPSRAAPLRPSRPLHPRKGHRVSRPGWAIRKAWGVLIGNQSFPQQSEKPVANGHRQCGHSRLLTVRFSARKLPNPSDPGITGVRENRSADRD